MSEDTAGEPEQTTLQLQVPSMDCANCARTIEDRVGSLEGVELSHEASVGKIAQAEIEYLMARGLDEEEATSTIVRGFLNVDIMGLPARLKNLLDGLLEEPQLQKESAA